VSPLDDEVIEESHDISGHFFAIAPRVVRLAALAMATHVERDDSMLFGKVGEHTGFDPVPFATLPGPRSGERVFPRGARWAARFRRSNT
jgi:hypothetical protein